MSLNPDRTCTRRSSSRTFLFFLLLTAPAMIFAGMVQTAPSPMVEATSKSLTTNRASNVVLTNLSLSVAAAHPLLDEWYTHGPAGRTSYSLAINPVTTTTLYTGTDNGVFKSVDSAESWTAASVGFPVDPGDSTPRTVFALAHDPQVGTPGILYAGVDVGDPSNVGTQLFKSTDGGGTWSPTGMPPVSIGIVALALDPSVVGDPSTQRTVYAGTGAGVWKSVDGGGTFTHVGTVGAGLTDQIVHSVALAASSPNVLYAGTAVGGIFKSLDGGMSWANASAGLPTQTDGGLYAIRALVIHPTDPNTVYAATGGGGVYQTTDGGFNWTETNNGIPGNETSSTRQITLTAMGKATPVTLTTMATPSQTRATTVRWWLIPIKRTLITTARVTPAMRTMTVTASPTQPTVTTRTRRSIPERPNCATELITTATASLTKASPTLITTTRPIALTRTMTTTAIRMVAITVRSFQTQIN